jgi:ankyrin repeat protein
MTALHFASQNGHADVVLSLIQANASTSAIVKGERKTALHLAAENGHYEVVQILARSKANVNAKSEGGTTALFLASRQDTDSSLRVLKALVLAEANPNLPIDDMMTPLHNACELGAMRTIQALVDARADVSATASGETPLHIAAKRGSEDAARILVAAGADVAAKTDGGLTAVDLAQRAGADECHRILAAAATAAAVDRRAECDSDQVLALTLAMLLLNFRLAYPETRATEGSGGMLTSDSRLLAPAPRLPADPWKRTNRRHNAVLPLCAEASRCHAAA